MNYYQPMNNYQNPYLERLQQMQQQQPMQITRVNGKNGADAFMLPPNSSVLLLDETAPIVWLKQADGAGYSTVTPYTITPYQQATNEPNYSDLEERIKRLEETINGKSDTASTRTKRKTDAE